MADLLQLLHPLPLEMLGTLVLAYNKYPPERVAEILLLAEGSIRETGVGRLELQRILAGLYNIYPRLLWPQELRGGPQPDFITPQTLTCCNRTLATSPPRITQAFTYARGLQPVVFVRSCCAACGSFYTNVWKGNNRQSHTVHTVSIGCLL